MSDILDKIVAVKREEVASSNRQKPLALLRADAESRVTTIPNSRIAIEEFHSVVVVVVFYFSNIIFC